MGRKGETTRQELITAARRLFRHQGFHATSLDDILDLAQVKRGNLYFHFKSKEDLALAALEEALAGEFPFLDRFMGAEPDPLARLGRMIDGVVGYIAAHDCRGG
jgi:AcrR family transcriptional regulator